MATIHHLGEAQQQVLLTLGAKGDAVLQLQRDLNVLRVTFIPIIENGTYDNDTANAVKAFQTKAGLPLSGSVDAETRAKLTEALQQNRTTTSLAPQAAVMPQAQPKPKLPLWQAGLMALGAIALVGGAYWVLKGDSEEATSKTDDDASTPDTSLSGSHVKAVKTPTKTKHPEKCDRTPTHGKGEVIVA